MCLHIIANFQSSVYGTYVKATNLKLLQFAKSDYVPKWALLPIRFIASVQCFVLNTKSMRMLTKAGLVSEAPVSFRIVLGFYK